MIYADGKEEKFQKINWLDKLQEEKFKTRILELMDNEVIKNFENKVGKAANFYDIEEETVN